MSLEDLERELSAEADEFRKRMKGGKTKTWPDGFVSTNEVNVEKRRRRQFTSPDKR